MRHFGIMPIPGKLPCRFFKQKRASRLREALEGFTLVELIVVITILAILATVWFLSLSGYSDDARTATVKANVRTVYSAILTESTTSGNSPRHYVSHDATAALSGAFAFVDGKSVALTGGDLGVGDSNYTAGNPRWDRLRMNGDKFKLAFAGPEGIVGMAPDASAAYSTGELAVGAVDIIKTGANGRRRATPFFQVAGVVSGSKVAVVSGNLAGGTAGGLVRDPASADPAYSLADGMPSSSSVPETCKALKTANPSVGDGTYRIDPDGSGTWAAISAYCDMTTEGGGWTLVANAKNTGGWFAGQSELDKGFSYGIYSPSWDKATDYWMNFSKIGFKDIVFQTGDRSFYCGFDYASVMATRNTENNMPNIKILYAKNTVLAVGSDTNVLWRTSAPEDPWIGCAGTHTDNSYNYAMTFWGENDSIPWNGCNPSPGATKHNCLKNNNGGMGVFVR